MIRLGYFLEDLGQEGFVRALVDKIVDETSHPRSSLEHVVRNATGGYARTVEEFGKFLRSSREASDQFHALVVVIDADCEGAAYRRRRLNDLISRVDYLAPTIVGTPDPHIERWYMSDPVALQLTTGSQGLAALPPRRCQRDLYKNLLRAEFEKGGVSPPFGGAEFAADIVDRMDLYRAAQNDTSLSTFIGDLRAFFASVGR